MNYWCYATMFSGIICLWSAIEDAFNIKPIFDLGLSLNTNVEMHWQPLATIGLAAFCIGAVTLQITRYFELKADEEFKKELDQDDDF
jgi:hypothetical protein